MKTFEILNSNGKGLFVKNDGKECNISDIVKQETPVQFTANGKSVIITAFNKRDFHREDSAFEYFLQGEEQNAGIKNVHGLQCAALKKILGFEADKKPRGENDGKKGKNFISVFEELKKYTPTDEELQGIIEYYNSIEKVRKNKKRIEEITKEITEKENEIKTLQKHNVAKAIIEKITKEIKKLNTELKELTK